jgi:methionyl-tRNA formyltransferase
VFAGTPQVALPSLAALLASERHEVVAVLTRPDAPAGRGRKLAPSPVRELAEAHAVPVLTPTSPREDGFAATLASYRPDCCPVVAYGAILPAPLLDVPPHGWVNLHFSLLPAWRGAAPVQHAIWHGDDVTGATTFRIEAGMDTGPTYGVLTETVLPRDTAGDLLARLADAGAQLLTATLDALEDGMLRAEPQPEEGVSLAPKITVDDARVDWTRTANAVDRQIRACTPAPGAWTWFRGERFKVGPVELTDSEGLVQGEIAGDLVGTGYRDVRLRRVQPAGKAPMDADAWARGARLEPGERFAAVNTDG